MGDMTRQAQPPLNEAFGSVSPENDEAMATVSMRELLSSCKPYQPPDSFEDESTV